MLVITKGHNCVKMFVELPFLFAANFLIMFFICIKFCKKYLEPEFSSPVLQSVPKSSIHTVKHLIFAVSNFRVFMKMIYWRILILTFMIFYGS